MFRLMLEACVWLWGKAGFREFLSQSSCLIYIVGFRKHLEQRSIRCNRPGNEMMTAKVSHINESAYLYLPNSSLLAHAYSPVDY